MSRGKKRRRPETSVPAAGAADVRTSRGVKPDAAADEPPSALRPTVAAALVFVAAGAVLVLEILAVRLLAPYVGLTLETTTSIIGAALAGIAAGAAIGGYLADRTNTRLLIVCLLIGGGMLTLLTVPAVRLLGPGARGDGDLAALGITVVALVPAAAVLSAVSPAVAHLQLHDLRVSGTIVGRLSAWATAGALIGTFGAGFVIVPLMPVASAILVIGIALIVIGIALGASTQALTSTAAFVILIAGGAFGALTATANSPCIAESSYHCIALQQGNGGYHLLLDNTYNSFVDPDNPAALLYPYSIWIGEALAETNPNNEPLDAVFVGGGGFTLPRWLEATRPGSTSRVLEVDSDLVEFVEDRLGLQPSADLRVDVGDARMTMRDVPDDSSDLVVGDAFSGYSVPWHLATAEWMDETTRVLKPGGVYALNMIDLGHLDLIRAELATLLDAFADVLLIAKPDANGEPSGGNLVMLASDRPFPNQLELKAEGAQVYDRAAVERFAAGAEPLRDDFAPVDQLQTQ